MPLMDRRIANCCLGSDRFCAPDKRGEAKTLARQTCFRINRFLRVTYPADVNCPLRDGFPHRTEQKQIFDASHLVVFAIKKNLGEQDLA